MTYQPERDGYGVSRDRAAATEDDRPIVVEDDGTERSVEDIRADLRREDADRAAMEADSRGDLGDGFDTQVEPRETAVETDGMGTPVGTSPFHQVNEDRIARDNAIIEGRHARSMDETAAADDPRVVRGRRIDAMAAPVEPATAVARERAAYGGIKWGSAFFGWLTAMGLAIVLTALVTAAGTALGLANDVNTTDDVANAVSGNASTIGIAGAIAVLLIILVSYFAGGYVAARMARLDGARQGFAVWVWSIAITLVLGLVALVVGNQYDVLGQLNTFPRIPIDTATVSTMGLVALVLAVVVSLVGALLGGLAGMSYHRRLDAAAFDPAVRREVVR